jgi:hypothetical protein
MFHPVKQMREDARNKEVPKSKRERRSEHKPISSSEWYEGKHSHTRHRDGGEEECRDAPKNRVWNGQKNAGYFTDDAEQDEEETAPPPGTSVRTTSNGDDAIVLGEY